MPVEGQVARASAVRSVGRRGLQVSGIEGCFPAPGHGSGDGWAEKRGWNAREVAACTWMMACWDANVHGDGGGDGVAPSEGD